MERLPGAVYTETSNRRLLLGLTRRYAATLALAASRPVAATPTNWATNKRYIILAFEG